LILDHYMLELADGCLAVVVGNTHASCYAVGYVKYCPASDTTIWCGRGVCYERVVKYYELREVYGYTPWRALVPCYGSTLPVIPYSAVKRVYDPLERAGELLSQVSDPLEKTALDMVEEILRGTSTLPGITGSLLPRIHSVEYSDVDLAVYGLRESAGVVEFIAENKSVFREFTGDKLREWCRRVAAATGLSVGDVEKLYRNWRRGLYGNREYSVVYNDKRASSVETEPAWQPLGVVEARVEFLGGLSGLNYPSASRVGSYRVLGGVNPGGDPEYVLSFEALYTPLLYEGGWGVVRGLLQKSLIGEKYRILVGVREDVTWIKPL